PLAVAVEDLPGRLGAPLQIGGQDQGLPLPAGVPATGTARRKVAAAGLVEELSIFPTVCPDLIDSSDLARKISGDSSALGHI
ncbi:MAG TPA: hypothetical protein VKA64_05875, partial [Gammaproteobacteria bacterium]|nr:hypothetical protein [Gammaproteobacteria bacterium]